MQTQQDDAIPVGFKGDVGSEVDLEPTNVWVTVESRRKSRKQDKGKAVVAFEPGVETNPIPSSSPVCTGPVQTSSGTNPLVATPCVAGVRASSPPCTESLAQPPCAGNEHRHSTPKTNTFVTTAGDAHMPGPPIPSPVVEVSAQSRVQTRNQKKRGGKDRISPPLAY